MYSIVIKTAIAIIQTIATSASAIITIDDRKRKVERKILTNINISKSSILATTTKI